MAITENEINKTSVDATPTRIFKTNKIPTITINRKKLYVPRGFIGFISYFVNFVPTIQMSASGRGCVKTQETGIYVGRVVIPCTEKIA